MACRVGRINAESLGLEITMPRTLISLGANLGNVRETMKLAQQMLQDEFVGGELRFSRLYRTPPVGGPDGQGDFLNGIAALTSDLDVWSIWESVKRVESGLGRHRLHRWEARRIDVDILLHSQREDSHGEVGETVRLMESVIWTPHFKVPHPRMCMRSFMLVPALEVAANWIEPVSGWTLERLAQNLKSSHPIVIATPSADLEEALKIRIANEKVSPHVRWVRLRSTAEFQSAMAENADWIEASKLLIVAIDNKDPEIVQWEDWSRDWAVALSMCQENVSSSNNSSSAIGLPSEKLATQKLGPRYLLPASDVEWAAHEIVSAYEALTCSIDVCMD